jgi:outer membrane biogenesis lipoprotein LolB
VSIPTEVVQPFAEQLHAEAARRTSVRGSARVRLESPQGSGSAREIIIVQRPIQLRLETLNLLGQTQAVLVTDRDGFVFFDGAAFERGALSDGLLRERMGLDLTPEEAVEVLLAAPEFDPAQLGAALAVGDEQWVETDRGRLRIGPEGELRGFQALTPWGGVRWTAEYDQWRDVTGGRYPFVVRLEFPGTGTRAELSLREAEVNPTLDPSLFDLRLGAAR